MRSKRKRVLFAIGIATGLASAVLGAYIGWREHARSQFSGCNMAHREVARVEVESLEIELRYAMVDKTASPFESQTLSQRLSRAQADLQKWDRHVRRYGHLCGTKADETR